MSGDYESIALVKPEIFVFRIPPIGTNRGHKAADWKLDTPDWTGRMKLVSIGNKVELRLEDKTTGALYAKCPIEGFPSVCVEPVTDSSRYFVIQLRNDSGQTAFVGFGFADRGDSFDFNVALQDHFKYVEKSAEFEQQQSQSQPSLDLAFKEGQTISINLKKNADGQPVTSRPRATPSAGGIVPLLPPPPGGVPNRARVPPPTSAANAPKNQSDLFEKRTTMEQARKPDVVINVHEDGALNQAPNEAGVDADLFAVAVPAAPVELGPRDPAVVAEHLHRIRRGMDHFPGPAGQALPTALRRLQRDLQKLLEEPITGILAMPTEENILEWHYVIMGSADTSYEGGYYHGKVVFKPDFPWQPPAICMITPNGRFRTNMRLCLSISDYHPESWNPGWTVSSILVGLHSFMNEESYAAGVVNDSHSVRKEFARKSINFNISNPEFNKMFPELASELRATGTSVRFASATPKPGAVESKGTKVAAVEPPTGPSSSGEIDANNVGSNSRKRRANALAVISAPIVPKKSNQAPHVIDLTDD